MLPLPPEPDHFTAGDLVGVANIIADVDTYLSVEACARAVLERAVRDGLVRGVVPAPPPEGPWIVRPWISDPEEAKKRLGKNSLSSMLGWWRVFRGGMHTGAPQPSGAFETEAEAVAVRDALNRLADGVRAVPAPQEGPQEPQEKP